MKLPILVPSLVLYIVFFNLYCLCLGLNVKNINSSIVEPTHISDTENNKTQQSETMMDWFFGPKGYYSLFSDNITQTQSEQPSKDLSEKITSLIVDFLSIVFPKNETSKYTSTTTTLQTNNSNRTDRQFFPQTRRRTQQSGLALPNPVNHWSIFTTPAPTPDPVYDLYWNAEDKNDNKGNEENEEIEEDENQDQDQPLEEETDLEAPESELGEDENSAATDDSDMEASHQDQYYQVDTLTGYPIINLGRKRLNDTICQSPKCRKAVQAGPKDNLPNKKHFSSRNPPGILKQGEAPAPVDSITITPTLSLEPSGSETPSPTMMEPSSSGSVNPEAISSTLEPSPILSGSTDTPMSTPILEPSPIASGSFSLPMSTPILEPSNIPSESINPPVPTTVEPNPFPPGSINPVSTPTIDSTPTSPLLPNPSAIVSPNPLTPSPPEIPNPENPTPPPPEVEFPPDTPTLLPTEPTQSPPEVEIPPETPTILPIPSEATLPPPEVEIPPETPIPTIPPTDVVTTTNDVETPPIEPVTDPITPPTETEPTESFTESTITDDPNQTPGTDPTDTLPSTTYPDTTTIGTTEEPTTTTRRPAKPPPPYHATLRCRCGVQSTSSVNMGLTRLSVNTNPWLVEISFRGRHLCTGTLISDRYILTAASCVKKINDKSLVIVTSGLQSRVPVKHSVYKIAIHPKYRGKTRANNVALLGIKNPIVPSQNSRPVCLPFTNPHTSYDSASVSTFIYNPKRKVRLNVLQSEVQLLNNTFCQTVLNKHGMLQSSLVRGTFCAEAPEQQPSNGDIGGSLQGYVGKFSYEQIGLVNSGVGCRRSRTPGVYTSIRPYIRWILFRAQDGQFCKDPKQTPKDLSRLFETELQI